MNGEEAQSIFSHMLQHVVNHATYHRGQVTTMLRQLGAPPPKSQDLIQVPPRAIDTFTRVRLRFVETFKLFCRALRKVLPDLDRSESAEIGADQCRPVQSGRE